MCFVWVWLDTHWIVVGYTLLVRRFFSHSLVSFWSLFIHNTLETFTDTHHPFNVDRFLHSERIHVLWKWESQIESRHWCDSFQNANSGANGFDDEFPIMIIQRVDGFLTDTWGFNTLQPLRGYNGWHWMMEHIDDNDERNCWEFISSVIIGVSKNNVFQARAKLLILFYFAYFWHAF